MIRIANNALENCSSIEQVVELINDEFATDASAEMVAASYAATAAIENGFSDDADVECQLELLAEAGADFNFSGALTLALKDRDDQLAE